MIVPRSLTCPFHSKGLFEVFFGEFVFQTLVDSQEHNTLKDKMKSKKHRNIFSEKKENPDLWTIDFLKGFSSAIFLSPFNTGGWNLSENQMSSFSDRQKKALEELRRARSGVEKRSDQHHMVVEDIYETVSDEKYEEILEERKQKGAFVVDGSLPFHR